MLVNFFMLTLRQPSGVKRLHAFKQLKTVLTVGLGMHSSSSPVQHLHSYGSHLEGLSAKCLCAVTLGQVLDPGCLAQLKDTQLKGCLAQQSYACCPPPSPTSIQELSLVACGVLLSGEATAVPSPQWCVATPAS